MKNYVISAIADFLYLKCGFERIGANIFLVDYLSEKGLQKAQDLESQRGYEQFMAAQEEVGDSNYDYERHIPLYVDESGRVVYEDDENV